MQKLCTICGTDVADKKRVKDPQGKYYCEPCYGKLRQGQQSGAQPEAVGAAAAVAAPPRARSASASKKAAAPKSEAAPPADDGMMELAPIKDFAPPDEEKFGCSVCKKLVSKRQIRNEDGEFICLPCFGKRNQAQRGTAASKAKPVKAAKGAPQDEAPAAEGFAQSIVGSLVISGAILAAGFGVFLGLYMGLPLAKQPGMIDGIVYGVVSTIFVAVKALGLLISMVIAAKMLGGINFGYIGPAFYKSMGLFLVLSALNALGEKYESMAFINIGLGFIMLIGAFMLLFKLDGFEAFLLSVVNSGLNWVLNFALLILLAVVITSARGHSDADAGDEGDVPAKVAPGRNARRAPADAPANAQPDAQGAPASQPDANAATIPAAGAAASEPAK